MAVLGRAMGSAALEAPPSPPTTQCWRGEDIIRDLPPCKPVLTSPTPVLKAPCRQLTDPVIACSALALSANDLLDVLTAERYASTARMECMWCRLPALDGSSKRDCQNIYT